MLMHGTDTYMYNNWNGVSARYAEAKATWLSSSPWALPIVLAWKKMKPSDFAWMFPVEWCSTTGHLPITKKWCHSGLPVVSSSWLSICPLGWQRANSLCNPTGLVRNQSPQQRLIYFIVRSNGSWDTHMLVSCSCVATRIKGFPRLE